jgi:hypothetical protein
MTPIEEFYKDLQKWQRLGWLPYCPKGVRNILKGLPFWMPYNLRKLAAARSYRRYEKRKAKGLVNN